MRTSKVVIAGALLLAGLAVLPVMADLHGEAESDNGVYSVSYTSAAGKSAVNKMHEWVLHVETPDGDPVENAEITVDGGMPAHDHGLPTAPRVTEYLGDGDYRVRGLRFHMRGEWIVTFDIREADRGDTVTFELTL